ncbi:MULTISPECIES: MaoC family dehydratase [Desulfatibacillum]|jgi:acyl dehydratase|uniref:MaoC domain protein dehydratase n=2 Tax=Desulfatibacillum TaxID=218207 RepID=B8FCF1_DESAL|nr:MULTISPECIES: MaoC family dehydratase [Desulfatibacillum]ACL05569.1 MaoC domain protein dehydratase [Desulfatibacillum aliphaticivorans]SHI94577.1 Acyl dehydratase [Desulfatibacillum alkenivorans DSM 16219]
MVETLPVEKMKERIGQELGVSDWVQIDQDRINKFADCTEDHQWIHVDEKMAAEGPFGTTIAHGFLSLSLIPFLSGDNMVLPEGTVMAINYGLNKVRFINPVKVGSKVRDRVVLTNVEEKSGNRVLVTTTNTIEIDGEDKPACIAESLAMFFVQ